MYPTGSGDGLMAGRVQPLLPLFVLAVSHLVGQSQAGTRMLDPPSRATLWRYGYNTPRDTFDDRTDCGGYEKHYVQNDGECGVCGDPSDDPIPRKHEAGGEFSPKPTPVRAFQRGSYVTVVMETSSSLFGKFEFRLCNISDNMETPSQSCFDNQVLPILEAELGVEYLIGSRQGVHVLNLQLPADVMCRHCILQWMHKTGFTTNPGTCLTCPSGESKCQACKGCGNQVWHVGCTDISIYEKFKPLPDEPSTSPPTVSTIHPIPHGATTTTTTTATASSSSSSSPTSASVCSCPHPDFRDNLINSTTTYPGHFSGSTILLSTANAFNNSNTNRSDNIDNIDKINDSDSKTIIKDVGYSNGSFNSSRRNESSIGFIHGSRANESSFVNYNETTHSWQLQGRNVTSDRNPSTDTPLGDVRGTASSPTTSGGGLLGGEHHASGAGSSLSHTTLRDAEVTAATITERHTRESHRTHITTQRYVTASYKPHLTTQRHITESHKPHTTTQRYTTASHNPHTTTQRLLTASYRPGTSTHRLFTTTQTPHTTTERLLDTTGGPHITTQRQNATSRRLTNTIHTRLPTTHRPHTTTQKHLPASRRPNTTTQKNLSTSRRPHTTTQKHLPTSRRPNTITQKHLPTSRRPNTSTQKHLPTSRRPNNTTQKHLPTSRRPNTTTQKHLPTSRRPHTTTQKHLPTSRRPNTTTQKHLPTSRRPHTTTQKHLPTSRRPNTTTQKHLPTSRRPHTTTQKHLPTSRRPNTTTQKHLPTSRRPHTTTQKHLPTSRRPHTTTPIRNQRHPTKSPQLPTTTLMHHTPQVPASPNDTSKSGSVENNTSNTSQVFCYVTNRNRTSWINLDRWCQRNCPEKGLLTCLFDTCKLVLCSGARDTPGFSNSSSGLPQANYRKAEVINRNNASFASSISGDSSLYLEQVFRYIVDISSRYITPRSGSGEGHVITWHYHQHHHQYHHYHQHHQQQKLRQQWQQQQIAANKRPYTQLMHSQGNQINRFPGATRDPNNNTNNNINWMLAYMLERGI